MYRREVGKEGRVGRKEGVKTRGLQHPGASRLHNLIEEATPCQEGGM